MRQFLSNAIMALGLWIAPRAVSTIMVTFLKAVPEMQKQVEAGRRGGIIFIPWGITDDGLALGIKQRDSCQLLAEYIRQESLNKEIENAQAV